MVLLISWGSLAADLGRVALWDAEFLLAQRSSGVTEAAERLLLERNFSFSLFVCVSGYSVGRG